MKMKKSKIKKSKSDIVMDVIIYGFLLLFALICLYPVWYVVAASFADGTELAKHSGLFLWPQRFMLGAYKMVFQNRLFMNGFLNSIKILLVALPINIVMTLLCGYFMSCSGMLFKKPISYLIMFTMFFSGGLIPRYLNMKDLGLIDSFWVLVLPTALNVYNAIICKTAIEAIPESLKESAYIDGANDIQIIFKIIVPLLKPTLAVLLLYYGVAHWNSWFPASIYIKDNMKLPVQNILRDILLENTELSGASAGDEYNMYAETIRYVAIVVSTLPIMCIYPFLQKYFAKGAMIGAVKG